MKPDVFLNPALSRSNHKRFSLDPRRCADKVSGSSVAFLGQISSRVRLQPFRHFSKICRLMAGSLTMRFVADQLRKFESFLQPSLHLGIRCNIQCNMLDDLRQRRYCLFGRQKKRDCARSGQPKKIYPVQFTGHSLQGISTQKGSSQSSAIGIVHALVQLRNHQNAVSVDREHSFESGCVLTPLHPRLAGREPNRPRQSGNRSEGSQRVRSEAPPRCFGSRLSRPKSFQINRRCRHTFSQVCGCFRRACIAP